MDISHAGAAKRVVKGFVKALAAGACKNSSAKRVLSTGMVSTDGCIIDMTAMRYRASTVAWKALLSIHRLLAPQGSFLHL